MENTTAHDAASVSTSEFLYGNESRLVAIIAVGAVFAIVTIVGNLMVMVSFKIDKQLQTISNYFLFSLAVADIAIGMISIPLWTYYTAMRSWGIGYTMCQFWLCVDYLMSNASVLNLLLISFDRYFSVTRPLSYRPRRTTRKALVMIACTYIISMILWPPWIISWPYIEGKFTVEPGICVVQFLETNPYVTVGTAVAAFYLPVSIMIVLYSRVYYETRKRRKEFGKLQASQVIIQLQSTTNVQNQSPWEFERQVTRFLGLFIVHFSFLGTVSPMKNGRLSKSDRKSEKEKKKNERKQESKAAKTLSAILAAFIVTWTPYNVIVCYEAFFPNSVPDYLFTASYFLCYINSTINPLCYALCNARFRHTYRRILKYKFGVERPNVYSNAYVRRQ
uniref:G_PROTEIN_RECEP_F1_2 domain-containing protein n=1 Tax=Angiostrongylus cantonensis TaxID=6313 RepID=A0A158P9J1_ANGCA